MASKAPIHDKGIYFSLGPSTIVNLINSVSQGCGTSPGRAERGSGLVAPVRSTWRRSEARKRSTNQHSIHKIVTMIIRYAILIEGQGSPSSYSSCGDIQFPKSLHPPSKGPQAKVQAKLRSTIDRATLSHEQMSIQRATVHQYEKRSIQRAKVHQSSNGKKRSSNDPSHKQRFIQQATVHQSSKGPAKVRANTTIVVITWLR